MMDDDDDFLYGGGGAPAHEPGSVHDPLSQRGILTVMTKKWRVFHAVEYVFIVLRRVDTLPPPEKRWKPSPASRTLQNL